MSVKKYRIVLISVIVCLAVLAGILVLAEEKEETEIYGGDFVSSKYQTSAQEYPSLFNFHSKL